MYEPEKPHKKHRKAAKKSPDTKKWLWLALGMYFRSMKKKNSSATPTHLVVKSDHSGTAGQLNTNGINKMKMCQLSSYYSLFFNVKFIIIYLSNSLFFQTFR